ALGKLEYCDRTLRWLADQKPLVTATELDEDVGALGYSLEHYYASQNVGPGDLPPGLDGALRSIFADADDAEGEGNGVSRQPASELIRRLQRDLAADVYRWTGHFPERTRILLRHLAERADQ